MSNWPPTCHECGAPMIGGRCPRCRYDPRPLGGKITYTAGQAVLGGQPTGGLAPLFVGSATSVSSSDTTLTVSGVTKPAGAVLIFGLMRSWSGTGIGANGYTATHAGQSLTAFSEALTTFSGNSYRTGSGTKGTLVNSAISGDVVLTFTGTVPLCKVAIVAVVPAQAVSGTGNDFAVFVDSNSVGTSFTFLDADPPTTATQPNDVAVALHLSAGNTSDILGQWGYDWTHGIAVGSGGAVPVAIDYANKVLSPLRSDVSKTWPTTELSSTHAYGMFHP